MKTEDFHKFITDLELPADNKHYLLMDNLSVHHAKQSCIDLGLLPIKDLLKSKNIEPEYLPPYTPELNPVELCFNFLRQNTEKKKPRTTEELKFYIGRAMKALYHQDLTKYFQHCWNYFKVKENEEKDRVINQTDPLIRQEMFKAIEPWKGYSRLVFPSQKWKRLGNNPTKQNIISSWKRVGRCVARSLELAQG